MPNAIRITQTIQTSLSVKNMYVYAKHNPALSLFLLINKFLKNELKYIRLGSCSLLFMIYCNIRQYPTWLKGNGVCLGRN